VKAVIDVDGKQTAAKGRLYVSLKQDENEATKKQEYVSAPMRMTFNVAGKDLGLKRHADRQVRVDVYTEAFARRRSAEEIRKEIGTPTLEKSSGAAAAEFGDDLGLDL
jgi:hypothetical protein